MQVSQLFTLTATNEGTFPDMDTTLSLLGLNWLRLNELIVRIHRAKSQMEIQKLAVMELPAVLEADYASWNVQANDPFLCSFDSSPAWYDAGVQLLPELNETMHTHPVVSNVGLLGPNGHDMKDVYAMGDFVSQRELHETPIYREAYRHLEAEYQLSTHFLRTTESSVILTVNSRKSIPDRGRFSLVLLREHFRLACTRIHELHEARSALAERIGKLPDEWIERLSRREVDIAREILRGLRNEDIGHRLGISRRTVEKHVERVLYKLCFATRRELILAAQTAAAASADD